ncbi:hypothetical protein [Streptomyces sp. NBC_01614]|uniref:hypothetical protein n=1 Tax=Streptomyces sp. NBC_01614 TaxID=2975897 RepID=UPI003867518F
MVNAGLKRSLPMHSWARDQAQLTAGTRWFFHRRQRQPHIVRGYFGGPYVRHTLEQNPLSFGSICPRPKPARASSALHPSTTRSPAGYPATQWALGTMRCWSARRCRWPPRRAAAPWRRGLSFRPRAGINGRGVQQPLFPVGRGAVNEARGTGPGQRGRGIVPLVGQGGVHPPAPLRHPRRSPG